MPLDLESRFCENCGANVKDEIEGEEENDINESQDVKHCSNCNTPLEEGSSFCENCGTPVSEDDKD